MRGLLFLSSFFIASSALAGLSKISVQNLDLEYMPPFGKGTVERVGIGMELSSEPYAIEVHRLADSFELTSPYLDFSWIHPTPFFHQLEKFVTHRVSANLGSNRHHFIEGEFLLLRPEGRGDYTAKMIKGSCIGEGKGTFAQRLMNDCRDHMNLTIKEVDVPTDFILYKVIESFTGVVTPEDFPADHLVVSSRAGDYALELYVKYWVRAGLRSWGHIQFENENKTVAIRVDKIKFGYLSVTSLVMKKLKELNTSPDVTIDPPWIRIKLAD